MNGLFVARFRLRVAAHTLIRIVRAAMTAAAAMEAVALAVVAVRAATVLRRLHRLSAGDERGQAADVVAAGLRLCLRLWLALLRLRLILRLCLRPRVLGLRLLASAV